MSDGLGFLTAVYRDGRVHIGGKSYPAGTFAVQLLNQYYKDDTAARIAVFRQSNWNVQEQLCAGYLNETDFIKAGKEILTILQTLPKLKPFSSLDIAAEKQRIAELVTGATLLPFPTICGAEQQQRNSMVCSLLNIIRRCSKPVKRCAQPF